MWEYLAAKVRATTVSGRFAYGFQTDLYFADVGFQHVGYYGEERRLSAAGTARHASGIQYGQNVQWQALACRQLRECCI